MSRSPTLFECVPNFSEGRRVDVLDAIKKAARVPGVRVLGLDSDPDHNRAVLTLMGERKPLAAAVFESMITAAALIDLRLHHGTHPRIGAVDVVPFVPWQNATMEQAKELSYEIGERAARELHLPVFYYAKSALRPEHVNLADVRRGEFEGLSERLLHDPPDQGPSVPHPTAGAVAIGARHVLIAFNVYLDTPDLGAAKKIARAVRGSSGGLVGVKALAMDIRSRGRVQVSMNLVDYRTTSLPRALEMVRREAERLGFRVVESEVVGLMPFAAVEDVVQYYVQMPDFDRKRVIELADD